MHETHAVRPEGIPGSRLSGPHPVGAYARKLRDELRKRARVQLFGEVWGLRTSRARAYFELRDADGAVPCSMWRDDLDALRPAGEGDLLAQLDLLRKRLDGEGLLEPQKRLARPVLPRAIGVVTGEGGKARDDVLAGLRRRGWAGRVVWAFAPVQDRHAAPAITRALQDLAACGQVDVIVVARGGGSLADLFCFCDETLCRTVALLRVPVIASVGHHTDRTLLDDVAAASCSTPTHAAETAVPCHCGDSRAALARAAGRLAHHGAAPTRERARLTGAAARLAGHARRAVLQRARALAGLSRAPAEAVARERARLHQSLRELRASALRGVRSRRQVTAREGLVLARKAGAADLVHARRRRLDALALALAAHDPGRTLARGYALVEDGSGDVVTSAEAARAAGSVRVRFADAAVDATIKP